MDRPTLQQLQYLVALAESEHFGRAAEATHVSQPGLSSQIKALEERLGVVLVERTTRGAHLTPPGQEVASRARQVLRDIDDLVRVARQASVGLAGPLELGVIPTMAPYLLPRLVPVVANRFPEAELGLREERTDALLALLRGGVLDLALLALPVDGDDLTAIPLAEDPFLLAVSASHPLARERGAATVDDLQREPVILLEDGHCLRTQALGVCELAGATTTTLRAASLATLVQMVAAGHGITLLPASTVGLEARPGNGVVVRRLAPPAPSRTMALVWRRSSPRADSYQELARLLAPVVAPGRTARKAGATATR